MRLLKWFLPFFLLVFALSACTKSSPTPASTAVPTQQNYPVPSVNRPTQGTYPIPNDVQPTSASSSSSLYPPPSGTPQQVDWPTAKASIVNGFVYKIDQAANLEVTLYLKDGSVQVATEPAKDDIKAAITECGAFCSAITINNK